MVSTCSNHWTTSLIASGLRSARTAREVIRPMGEMAEDDHGLLGLARHPNYQASYGPAEEENTGLPWQA